MPDARLERCREALCNRSKQQFFDIKTYLHLVRIAAGGDFDGEGVVSGGGGGAAEGGGGGVERHAGRQGTGAHGPGRSSCGAACGEGVTCISLVESGFGYCAAYRDFRPDVAGEAEAQIATAVRRMKTSPVINLALRIWIIPPPTPAGNVS